MKPGTNRQLPIQQREILLFPAANLLSNRVRKQPGSAYRYWEQKSWAGLISQLIPVDKPGDLSTWHVIPGRNFIWINQASAEQPIEMSKSIDPYLYLLCCCMN